MMSFIHSTNISLVPTVCQALSLVLEITSVNRRKDSMFVEVKL